MNQNLEKKTLEHFLKLDLHCFLPSFSRPTETKSNSLSVYHFNRSWWGASKARPSLMFCGLYSVGMVTCPRLNSRSPCQAHLVLCSSCASGSSAGGGMISPEHSCRIPEILHIMELSAKTDSPQCVSQRLKNMQPGSIFSTHNSLKYYWILPMTLPR